MRPLKGQIPKAPPTRRVEPNFSVPPAPKKTAVAPAPTRPSAPKQTLRVPQDDPRVRRTVQQPAPAQERRAAPESVQERAPAPIPPKQRVVEQPQATPQEPPAKNRSHLNLRTAQLQGDLGGNVQPLGAIPVDASQKLFGQKPAKKVIARDPAPSRVRYRMQRLWLTPMIRTLVRKGLPLIVLLGVGGYLAQDPALRDKLTVKLAETRENIQSRPEFRVELMKIKGVDVSLGERVRAATGLTLPMTSFDLKLDEIRTQIEALDGVKTASLFLRSGGVLDIEVDPRVPVVLWRKDAQTLEMLDKTGTRAGLLSARGLRSDLPVIVGAGADQHIDQALEILTAAQSFAPRIRGLTRIGERRWDLVLDRDQTIKLPVENPIAALRRVVALNEAQNLLDRDILAVDLRNADRPSLQLSSNAMRGLRGVETVSSEEKSDL